MHNTTELYTQNGADGQLNVLVSHKHGTDGQLNALVYSWCSELTILRLHRLLLSFTVFNICLALLYEVSNLSQSRKKFFLYWLSITHPSRRPREDAANSLVTSALCISKTTVEPPLDPDHKLIFPSLPPPQDLYRSLASLSQSIESILMESVTCP